MEKTLTRSRELPKVPVVSTLFSRIWPVGCAGPIPTEIGRLRAITHLYLYINQLAGAATTSVWLTGMALCDQVVVVMFCMLFDDVMSDVFVVLFLFFYLRFSWGVV